MSLLLRTISFVGFWLLTSYTQAQTAAPDAKRTITMSAQIQVPLLGYLPSADIHLNQEDSLARLAYVRNKIRSVIKVRIVDDPAEIDTMNYTEFDRQGNKTLLYNPDFKARTIRHYDKRGRIIESIQFPPLSDPDLMREVLDPDKGLYTSFPQPEGSPVAPLLTVTHQRRGDTLISRAILHQPVTQQGYTLTQVIGRRYTVGRDTIRLDALGYDDTRQPQGYQSIYLIRRNGRTIEDGVVSFQKPLQALLDTSARARQWRSQGLSDAAILLRQAGKLKGTYLATTYSQYDKNGWLIRSETTTPAELLAKPTTQESEQGTMTSVSASSSQVSYQYDARGHIIREERTASFPELQEGQQTVTTWIMTKENTYSSNGLQLSEQSRSQKSTTGKVRATRYEYRYTRF